MSFQGEETSRETQWTARARRRPHYRPLEDYRRSRVRLFARGLRSRRGGAAPRNPRRAGTRLARRPEHRQSLVVRHAWASSSRRRSTTSMARSTWRRPSNSIFSRTPRIRAGSCAVNYSVGPYRAWYNEETLYGKFEDTLGRHEASVTLDQREPWGSLEAPVRGVELSARSRPSSAGARERRLDPPRARPLVHRRRRGDPAARPALAAEAQRDRRGGAPAPAPVAERVRVRAAGRTDLHVRIDFQHHREPEVRAVTAWRLSRRGSMVVLGVLFLCGKVAP